MNSNMQIEALNRELKQTLIEIQQAETIKEKQTLEKYAEELKANIQDLCSSIEVNYELIFKTMLLKALENAVLYQICKREELHAIIHDLYEIGVPREIMTSDKETLTRYLQNIEYENPKKFERYQDFIRIIQSKTYKSKPKKRQEFVRDFYWLIDDDSLATEIMETLQLDSIRLKNILYGQENENFEQLVDRYHLLMSL